LDFALILLQHRRSNSKVAFHFGLNFLELGNLRILLLQSD
jgi:hypothetical protein